jgi:protein transport protein SEC13
MENLLFFFQKKRHNGPVWQIAWAHPSYGNIIASCGFDKKVAIWKEVAANDWKLVISHQEHQGSGIYGLCLSKFSLV